MPELTGARIKSVEIGVSDLARSTAFYRELLQGEFDSVTLVEVGANGVSQPAGNLRCGLSHLGWKVGDVDMQATRLHAAGVEFTVEPTDAHGGVRIAFFTDPDGTVLELIDSHLKYDTTFSPKLDATEQTAADARSLTFGPVLDHVAATVDDLDRSLSFYRNVFGYEPIGQLDLGRPEGCLLTMVGSGDVALEPFTYTAPTSPNPTSGENTLGLRSIGVFGADDEAMFADPDGIALRLA
jgi:catechol 2,3-dioxygenase-like lactoylglutathione lyase family enzyme